MRQLDWSRTTLGPVERWSQSLRTSVSTCLNCAFPIVLWWGPELAILYNDEYRQILGPEKHPAALGQPGATVWAEIWDVIGPMLSQVFTEAEPTRSRDLLLHIDRGYLEEAYFSFSYSPIHDEEGKIAGIFCPVIETTEKVIGERRLRTLRDLAARCKGAESEDATLDAAATILAANPQDIPFAMIYQVEERLPVAVLKVAAGIARGTAASPTEIRLDEDGPGVWTVSTVAHASRIETLTDLTERFTDLPTGAWKAPPTSAKVIPITMPGQHHPRAILIAAISPMRALDDDYRTFFRLIAAQIASGLADAQAREAERRRAEALAELDRAKTTFFSNVSHEFRTPLTLMIGPLEDLLTSTTGVSGEITGAARVAHRNALRLLKLVNTLLDFSRIEAGRIDASYEPTDLAAYTTELASVFRSTIEKAGLELVVDCDPLLESVYVDRDMWEKIVLNLLSNGFKFTFDGAITVRLRWRGEHVELTVTDTGVGIPESDLPLVFQRFHRVKNDRARTFEGTGIGLALVQELARLHGGHVAVTSREGHGTTFTVRVRTGTAHLPPERISAGRQLASTSVGANPYVEEALRWLPATGEEHASIDIGGLSDSGPITADREPRARVLVADDNADMREYLGRILRPSYHVESVPDGKTALDRIRANPPDLILTDVMMPNLDGFGLLSAIRGDEHLRSLPVIMLSARAGEEARIEGLTASADDYLVKPFSARDLLARIGSQLALARLRKESDAALRSRSEELEESERKLREADARKDEFLALLAHELRNPLAPIRTGLELIRLAGDSQESVKKTRELMERQVAHMVRLIDDLLDISRIASGKIVLQRVPTALNALVQGAIDAQRLAIDANRIDLSLELPQRPCVVNVDPTRFVQVLSNVIHNALKFTPSHGRIRVSALTLAVGGVPDAQLAISVTDNGMGIAKDVLPRVFDLFAQGDRGSGHGGLGIGLALARRLMELHGGTIDAYSQGPGHGSTFVMKMPLSRAKPVAPVPRTEVHRIRCRAVIIDDNEDAAETLSMVIQQLGGVARTAKNAIDGLDVVREFQPDFIFLDIDMPGIDGYRACRQIRSHTFDHAIVIVALTGWGQDHDKERAREAGFDTHLTKPVDPAAFEALLASAAPAVTP
ncbi:MAG TPA: ATP-binding protein [Vicinamibacterales bacterium]|nr:ATP-binding protein [Vicinamibacterales bacterium]